MIRKITLTSLSLIIILSIFLITNFALAQFGLDRFTSGSGGSFPIADQNVIQVVVRVISIIIGIIGVLLLALIVYGGVLYATSAGNEEQIDKGKKVLTYSIIGIIIVAFSYAITNYVVIGLFSDQSQWQQQGGGSGQQGGGRGNGGDGDGGDSDSGDTARRGQDLINQGNDAIDEGQEMIERGETMIEEGNRLIEQGDVSAGEILIDDGQELINRGNARRGEGDRILAEGQALQGEGGGDGGYQTDSSGRRTGPSDVDIDCQQVDDRCGIIRNFCCTSLECDGAIADSGWPAFAGHCNYGDPTCKEENERCVRGGQGCCRGLVCQEGYCMR